MGFLEGRACECRLTRDGAGERMGDIVQRGRENSAKIPNDVLAADWGPAAEDAVCGGCLCQTSSILRRLTGANYKGLLVGSQVS